MVKASLADIKEGAFIGVSARRRRTGLKRRSQFTSLWIRSAAL
jgi:hypothetical protein